MPAEITGCQKIGAGAWRYTFTGTAPFTVTSRGQQILVTSDSEEVTVTGDADSIEPPPIEVYDSTGSAATLQQTLYPPRVTIQFRGRTTNAYYVVSQYISGQWTQIATVLEDGRGYYDVVTPYAVTGEYQFRVTPYDESETAGIPLDFEVSHFTNPEPPELTYTYNAGTGNVTIAAAP